MFGGEGAGGSRPIFWRGVVGCSGSALGPGSRGGCLGRLFGSGRRGGEVRGVMAACFAAVDTAAVTGLWVVWDGARFFASSCVGLTEGLHGSADVGVIHTGSSLSHDNVVIDGRRFGIRDGVG